MKFSKKQKAFLTHKAPVECAEGQTYGGKTTVGAIKFILRVKASKKKLHAICGLDLGTVEKNIINPTNGILDYFGSEVDYKGNGDVVYALPHIYVKSNKGIKVVFVFGYADQSRWKKILGGQFGCSMIDEVNTADMDLVRELAMRSDYLLMTLNPDDPSLPIYSEYINHCRPLKEFEQDVPPEMMRQLQSQKPKDGWVHWFFRMDDNPTLTPEKKSKIINNVPEGTKVWKSKILGLRGRSEGLVITEFDETKIIPQNKFEDGSMWLPNERIYQVVCGLDSGLNADATALTISLMTTAGRLITIPTFYYVPQLGSNSNSQQATYIEAWLDYWLSMFRCCNPSIVSITGDSAALTQDLIYEINLRTKYSAAKVGAKDIMKDTQRVKSIVGTPNYWYIVNFGNRNPLKPQEKLGEDDMLIVEFNNIVWDKKKGNVPEDGNDHCFDSFKYQTYFMYYGMMGGIL